MIEILEKKLSLMAEAIACKKTPKKYRKQAAIDYIQLKKDLDKIYVEYTKLHILEKKIAKKYD